MSPAMLALDLYAQTRFDEISDSLNRGFGFRADTFTIFMGIFLVAVIAILIAFRIAVQRREARGKLFSHAQLFRELADGHSLSRSERQLLSELARSVDVSHASILFVRPDLFTAAAETYRARHPDAREDEALRQLQERLFAPNETSITSVTDGELEQPSPHDVSTAPSA